MPASQFAPVSASTVYVGIDVACAVGKQLPICVISSSDPPVPLRIPRCLVAGIPRGLGNREITSARPFVDAAEAVAGALKRIADEMNWCVGRIAVDAPAAAPAHGPRLSEQALGRLGLSSFRTPIASEWADIREKCADHLRSGGGAAWLPHANKIWMLFGFELFSTLRREFNVEVIEVYPFAIVRAPCHLAHTNQLNEDTKTSFEPSHIGLVGNRGSSNHCLRRLCEAADTIVSTHSWRHGSPPWRREIAAHWATLNIQTIRSGFRNRPVRSNCLHVCPTTAFG